MLLQLASVRLQINLFGLRTTKCDVCHPHHDYTATGGDSVVSDCTNEAAMDNHTYTPPRAIGVSSVVTWHQDKLTAERAAVEARLANLLQCESMREAGQTTVID
jgi:hypothetical protein